MHRQAWIAALLLALTDVPSSASPRSVAAAADRPAAAASPSPAKLYLRAPRPIPVAPKGPEGLTSALEAKRAVPLSLAASDFDEDGVPDVIAGFAHGKSGILSLHRGNIDAIYPNEPEAKKRREEGRFVEAGFLPGARVFPTPEPPDFVAAGDFDADGHWDVAAIRTGGSAIHFHRGDGHGGLADAESIPLPGPMTAAVSGEVNRRDGLADLVVAVGTPAGPRALVYEWPWGALRGTPEALALPAPATALALGKLEGRLPRDLVIAAGTELILVEGRDRRLPYAERTRALVGPPVIRSTPLPRTGVAVAIGDFGPGDGNEIAILTDDGHVRIGRPDAFESLAAGTGDRGEVLDRAEPGKARLRIAHLLHAGGDDLIVLDRETGKGHVLLRVDAASTPTGAERTRSGASRLSPDLGPLPVDLLPMRLNRDGIDDLLILAAGSVPLAEDLSFPESTYIVTNTNASGPGSLLAAIELANADPYPDVIEFVILGPPPYTIPRTGPLTVSAAVTIDGRTQPGYAGTPIIHIENEFTGVLLDPGSSGSVLSGLVVGSPGEEHPWE